MRPRNRNKLRSITRDALTKDKSNDKDVSTKWKSLVDEILENTQLSAEVGEYKYELDMSRHNIATVTRVAEVVREELGDVHVVVKIGKEHKSITTDWTRAR